MAQERTYTADDVAQMMHDIIRAITEGTLRGWEKRHFKALIQEQEQKAATQPDISQPTADVDLFEFPELWPPELEQVLSRYSEESELHYGQLEDMLQECNALGFTFEYGLDATPCNLKRLVPAYVKGDPMKQLVVINKHTLGIVHPEIPDSVEIMASSVLLGSPYPTFCNGRSIYIGNSPIRIATRSDLDVFRIHPDGMMMDKTIKFYRWG
jgi:hypothetical protein